MQEEIWKDISNYEGLYQISNLGRVKTLARKINCQGRIHNLKEKILKDAPDSAGYRLVVLCKNGTKKTHRIHRLVAEAFISNPDNKKLVNHKNLIKHDNNLSNLEWNTYRENLIHSYLNGRNKK